MKFAIVVITSALSFGLHVTAHAQGTCSTGTYKKYRWQYTPELGGGTECETTGWCPHDCIPQPGGTNLCKTGRAHVFADTFSCADDTLQASNSIWEGQWGLGICTCDAADVSAAAGLVDGTRIPGADQCGGSAAGSNQGCELSTPNPEQCNGTSPSSTAPIDKGCGNDELSCSAQDDADGAPLRFSSGRVESNPLTFFQQPAPDGMFFGYRMKWGSHVETLPAQGRCPLASCPGGVGADTVPTIHNQNEVTHFVGAGWLDNYSDRLYVHVENENSTTITWQSIGGTVTFQNVGGLWKSWGGKFELIDRGTPAPSDGYGRWVVRTTDTSKARLIWSFEEFTYTSYSSVALTLGRLRRHAILGSNLSNLTGTYGYTVNWTAAGPTATLSSVVDSLSREYDFTYYSPPPTNGVTVSRSLAQVIYKPSAGSPAQPVVSLQMALDNLRLDRVSSPGAAGYTRFLYYTPGSAITCDHCANLITDIVSAGTSTSTPAIQAPIDTSHEVVLEHDDYGAYGAPFATNILVGTHTRYPGHEYAYLYPSATTTTQYDLKFPCSGCAIGGPCPAGYAVYPVDGKCYASDTLTHDASTRLPTSRASTGVSGPTGNREAFTRNYNGQGWPMVFTDAASTNTTFGFDSLGRTRCVVYGDDNTQAFSDPSHPDTSACDAPIGAQTIRVDYNSGCTGGYSVCTVKTTTSVLSGNVTEEVDYNTATLLLERTVRTGATHDINGATIQQSASSTKTYDAYGRVTESNGPLSDAVALDKTTTSYYSGTESGPCGTQTSSYNIGHVFQETQYVGTSASSTPLTTTYCNYDIFGVPQLIIDPNGGSTTFTPTGSAPDRLTWDIVDPTGAKTTIVLNADHSIHTVTDPDNVCLAYEYTDNTGYVGAVTRMRRTTGGSQCSNTITSGSSGDVEVRAYSNGDPTQLASITRYHNGTQDFTYSGFTYDRDRRLIVRPH